MCGRRRRGQTATAGVAVAMRAVFAAAGNVAVVMDVVAVDQERD